MEVKLTNEEKNFLLEKVDLTPQMRQMLLKFNTNNSLEITEDESANFWERCSDKLETIGFSGKNDEPTIDGLMLEKIMDKFYC